MLELKVSTVVAFFVSVSNYPQNKLKLCTAVHTCDFCSDWDEDSWIRFYSWQ